MWKINSMRNKKRMKATMFDCCSLGKVYKGFYEKFDPKFFHLLGILDRKHEELTQWQNRMRSLILLRRESVGPLWRPRRSQNCLPNCLSRSFSVLNYLISLLSDTSTDNLFECNLNVLF